ncbi:MAG: HAD family hydrolase [Planctomycetota bacterium]|jgi:phosphoglycolate phosphatase|nr:HAD family hydrolase [Planctomycetota bacterium]
MVRRAVIFDFDGTLLDTLEDLADSMNQALAENGFPVHPADAYRYFVGDGMENLARRAAPPGTPPAGVKELAARMRDIYRLGWSRRTRPYPGVVPLLAELRRLDRKIALLSNKPDSFTREMARHYFGPSAFDLVFGAREGVPIKPDPAAALEIARALGLAPADFLYLGDTDTDMRTGRGAGMKTLGVAWGFRPPAELLAAGAEAIVHRPDEIPAFLGGG